jgi:N-acyl-D-aspartate/D-glutamate deacylase
MGHYVRDEKVITLEDAVRKASSHNAAKVRLFDRGLLRPGMWADVTVFNPDTIADKATYDNPYQYAVGVEYVLGERKSGHRQREPHGSTSGRHLVRAGHASIVSFAFDSFCIY